MSYRFYIAAAVEHSFDLTCLMNGKVILLCIEQNVQMDTNERVSRCLKSIMKSKAWMKKFDSPRESRLQNQQ